MNEKLIKFKVGEVVPRAKGQVDGCQFNFTQSGIVLFLCFENPTTEEIDSILNGEFAIKLLVKNDVMFFLLKFGTMQWMDAPYSPNLTEPDVTWNVLDEGKGYSINVILIDSLTGIVKTIRIMGLEHNFSMSFREKALELKNEKFDAADYDKQIANIYKLYSPEKLADMATYAYTLPKRNI